MSPFRMGPNGQPSREDNMKNRLVSLQRAISFTALGAALAAASPTFAQDTAEEAGDPAAAEENGNGAAPKASAPATHLSFLGQ